MAFCGYLFSVLVKGKTEGETRYLVRGNKTNEG